MMIIILQRLQCHSARKRCCFRLFYTDVMEKASHDDGFWPRRLCHSRRNKFRMFPQPSRQRFNAIRAGAENKPVLFHCCYHIHPNFRWPHLRRRQGHPTFALPVIRKKFHFFFSFFWSGNMDQTTLFGLVTLKWIRVKVVWKSRENRRRILPSSKKKKEKNTQPIHLCLWRLWCCHGNLTRPCCISFDMDQILAYGLIHLLCIPSPPGINLRLVYNIFSRYTHPISGMGGCKYISCHIDFQ